MIKCDLSPDEINILKEILESEISDLSMEISHTDRKDFRETLKTHRKVLQKLLSALEEGEKVEG